MLRMRDVSNDAQALVMEGRLEAVMAPTCNFVAPGGALLRDTWETIVNKLHLPQECKTLLLQTHHVTHTHADTKEDVHIPLATRPTEDRSGLVGKIATCWAKIGSRVWKGGRNDGLDGFLRFNNILKKSSKTGFGDR